MKRLSFIRWLATAASLVALNFASHAYASHPDILRNYRFIPEFSRLEVTGGFAGVDWDLTIAGKFGLVTGFEEGVSCAAIGCPPPPTHIPFAKFEDVDAIAFDPRRMSPMPSPGWDLDDTLNLSGLRGTFRPGSPNHLFFQGEDGQGVPFKLEAVIRGPIIHLRGVNDPNCPGCADFFGYKLNAFAYLRPFADVNLDGVVDAADYVMWRKTGGDTDTGSGGDDVPDPGDYNAWRTFFGDVADFSAFDEADFSINAVPEPATIALLLTALAIALSIRVRP
jgi:hypothetical protein